MKIGDIVELVPWPRSKKHSAAMVVGTLVGWDDDDSPYGTWERIRVDDCGFGEVFSFSKRGATDGWEPKAKRLREIRQFWRLSVRPSTTQGEAGSVEGG